MPGDELALRLLTVDDHPLFRRGVTSVINAEADMRVVAEAGDGAEAIAQYATHRPDVVLMDLRMPGMSGVDAIRHIRHADADARVLVLTTYRGDVEVTRALRTGALGYILKSTVVDTLAQAVREVAAGRRFIPPDIAASLATHALDTDLTAREVEVLQWIARGHSNASTAKQLGVSDETVKTHVSNILSKLGARDRTHAVAIGIERGIIAAS